MVKDQIITSQSKRQFTWWYLLNLKIISIDDIYHYRNKLIKPTFLNDYNNSKLCAICNANDANSVKLEGVKLKLCKRCKQFYDWNIHSGDYNKYKCENIMKNCVITQKKGNCKKCHFYK